jgi:hypothetical protein
MSIVRNKVPPTESELHASEPAKVYATTELHETESQDHAEVGSGIVNVTLHGVYTPAELMDGVKFNLSDYPVGPLPTGRVIVSEIATTAIGSHVGSNLMISSNLFNTNGKPVHYLRSGVSNNQGWATVGQQDELVPIGFAPLLSVMPNEYCRSRSVHYSPNSGVDDKLVQRYGHLGSGEDLRKGVVSFPGENYYFVAKDHVVLDIIEKNWEALGQSVPHERVREGNWIKVSNTLVDKVLDELDSSVLKHMPLTDLDALTFNMKADQELAEQLDSDRAHPVSITLSLAYRSVAPELEDA